MNTITPHYTPVTDSREEVPLISTYIQAGFPSPAEDHVEGQLDLNKYVIQHKEATFYLRVKGHSMINAGIHEGDILVVDRSIPASHGKIVVAIVDGELVVKRLLYTKDSIVLASENPKYPTFTFKNGQEVQVWGVVTFVVHKV